MNKYVIITSICIFLLSFLSFCCQSGQETMAKHDFVRIEGLNLVQPNGE